MIITETKNGILLKRYAGQRDGKNMEARIGVLSLNATVSSIEEDLRRNLTPNEFDKLVEFLNKKASEKINNRANGLASELKEVASAAHAGIVDSTSLDRIKSAAKAFLEVVEPGLFSPVKPKRSAKSKPALVVAENAAAAGA